MQEIQGKHAKLSIESPEKLALITRALSSQVRIDVLMALAKRSMSVGELAKELNIPMSSMALAVRILEEADLIMCDTQPGSHGSAKICNRKLDTISINLVPETINQKSQPFTLLIPIGSYALAEQIQPTCGLLSETHPLAPLDLPHLFYLPQRLEAQLIWFQQGFLEYHFAIADNSIINIDWLELSFEACSEAPMYRDPWPSDISVEINHKRLGTWTCPSDCGGRQGHLTPEWWGTSNTQFGFLKTWYVDNTGTYLDHKYISNTKISDLSLNSSPYISLRIGIDSTSKYVNGINLFGEKFGDHPQSIKVKIGYLL